ncbi:MAG: anti-sigma-I factor RsgI family protein [Bacillota bacterium]
MKKLVGMMMFVFIGVGLFACSTQGVEASSDTYLMVEINPAIEFILDEDDEVVSYAALNDDAETVLAANADVEFEDMLVDDAIELWLQLATEAGFLDATREDNVVTLTVVNDDEGKEAEVRERVRGRAEGYMMGASIGGAVENAGLTMEEFIQEAKDLGVSPGFLRMAYAASADEEITLEEALELSHQELMSIIKEAHGLPNHREHRSEHMPEAAQNRHPRGNGRPSFPWLDDKDDTTGDDNTDDATE